MSKGGRCQTCNHKAVAEIDALLLTLDTEQGTYEQIIQRFRISHPREVVLTKSGLSRHKMNHILSQPVAVENTKTGEIKYFAGNKLRQLAPITNDDVPEIPDIKNGLRIIIAAGLSNIAANPHTVTPKILMEALVELRKLEGGGDDNSLEDAWAQMYAAEAKRSRTKLSRSTTVTEVVETDTPLPLLPEPPLPEAEWTFDALPALVGGTDGDT